jgi:hypothetical protein
MPDGTCSIEGCGKTGQLTRGWCSKHYGRWRRHGDPNVMLRIIGDDAARLWSKIDVRGASECWPWRERTDRGYGILKVTRSSGTDDTAMAHRLAYEFTVGPIPDGCQIDHMCHVAEEKRRQSAQRRAA